MNFRDEDITAGWEEILNNEKYHMRLVEILDNYPDKKSLYIEYQDVNDINPDLAVYVLDSPDRAISLGKKALKNNLPATWEPHKEINFRLINLPRDAKVDVRNIRAKHLGKLIAVEGMVRKATTPKPRLVRARYKCAKCDADVWVPQSGMYQKEPLACPNEGCNKSAPRFNLDEISSEYIDTQKIEIQEK